MFSWLWRCLLSFNKLWQFFLLPHPFLFAASPSSGILMLASELMDLRQPQSVSQMFIMGPSGVKNNLYPPNYKYGLQSICFIYHDICVSLNDKNVFPALL